MIDADTKAQLDRIEATAKRLELATFGDKDMKIPGMVNDMHEMKTWRRGVSMKIVGLSALVGGAVVGLKGALLKLFTTL